MTYLSLPLANRLDAKAGDDSLRRAEAFLRCQHQRRRLFGEAGRIDQVTEWGGAEFRYQYDTNGDLTTLVEANDRLRRYGYDSLRRLCLVEYGDGLTTRYHYNDRDRLEAINDRGIVTSYGYDPQGRLATIRHGQSDVSVYRYDQQGRVILARTSQVTTCWVYDQSGRATTIQQSIGGVTLAARLHYDDSGGRLATLTLPGSDHPICYTWDERGRPQTVSLDQQQLAHFSYDDTKKMTAVALGNGIVTESFANPVDNRPWRQIVRGGEGIYLARTLSYADSGEIVSDGEREYEYDPLGRLSSAQDLDGGNCSKFEYDEMDNLAVRSSAGDRERITHARDCRLVSIAIANGAGEDTRFVYAPFVYAPFVYDRWGRLTDRVGAGMEWNYHYDDAGQLQEVRRANEIVARFLYDHKGRLAWAEVDGRVERYLYGESDELLAVTDGAGQPLRLLVRTPFGVLAEVHGAIGEGEIIFRHDDERGTTRLATNSAGAIVARFDYDPFGHPLPSIPGVQGSGGVVGGALTPCFTGRHWVGAIGLYYFGAPGMTRTWRAFSRRIRIRVCPMTPASSIHCALPASSHRYVDKFCMNGSNNRVYAIRMPSATTIRLVASIPMDIGLLAECC